MDKPIFEYEKNHSGLTLKKFITGGEIVEIPAFAEDAGELTGMAVTAIGAECFKENGIMILKITVPDTVRILEHDAFAYCVSLQELELPETIEMLGADYLIASGLSEAYIPASVNMIERPELIDRSFIVSPENKFFSTDGFGLYETREGLKKLIAVNASDEREEYEIAEGTGLISPGALCDISTLKKIVFPKELEIIEEGSLSYTGGRAGGSRGIEEISVSPFNERFVISYDCLCERVGEGGLKLIKYFGGDECRLGSDVVRIGKRCFKNTRLSRIIFDNTNPEIGDEAFSGCLLSYADINAEAVFFGEEDQFTTESFVLEFGKGGKAYDFGFYDSFLRESYLTEPRIRMICSRLKSHPGPDKNTEKCLREKISSSMVEVIELLAEAHNAAGLGDLGNLGFFTADNIDEYIELTGRLGEKEMTAWLMSYKNQNIGFNDDLDYL